MRTHWKKLNNPNYLGAYSIMDLPNQELTVTIQQVKKETIKTDRGSEECIVAYIKGQKPMILNTTNCKAIEKVAGTPFTEEWKNVSITLFVKRVKAFGDFVDALRVRPTKPKKPTLSQGSEAWNKALKAVESGNVTIEQIKAKYDISKQNETILNEAIQNKG